MFHRHFDDHIRHGHGGFGRGPFHGWRSHGAGFGRREGRMFDGGELRLAILALVAEKPRYGYEIIKELGERVGGDYSPSPGVVYPTLTMIEEMGYASASQDPLSRAQEVQRIGPGFRREPQKLLPQPVIHTPTDTDR